MIIKLIIKGRALSMMIRFIDMWRKRWKLKTVVPWAQIWNPITVNANNAVSNFGLLVRDRNKARYAWLDSVWLLMCELLMISLVHYKRFMLMCLVWILSSNTYQYCGEHRATDETPYQSQIALKLFEECDVVLNWK